MSNSKNHGIITSSTGSNVIRHNVSKPTSGSEISRSTNKNEFEEVEQKPSGQAKASPNFKEISEKTNASDQEKLDSIKANMIDPDDGDKSSPVNPIKINKKDKEK